VDSTVADSASVSRNHPAPARISVTKPEGEKSPQTAGFCPFVWWKRSLDLGCILLSLPFVLPLMGLIVLWIKLVSRGPAIFRQTRIGRDGKSFTLYKFRSMHLNADTRRHTRHFSHLVESNCPMVKLDLLSDPRLIPGGCLLRAAGLDELPQLLNVLRGEMSLVGPRPCLPEEYGYFTSIQRVRFSALPGLTGIWQTEGKGITTFTEMNAMDAYYVRKASLRTDLSIMWRTPCAILGQIRMAWKRRRISTGAHTSRPAMENKTATVLATQRLG
jgi:lipopolysaccharide/colanic/teichoic acid biosynthesis glycosyltransferase